MNEQKVKVAHKRGMSVGEAAIWCNQMFERTKNIYWWRVARRIARRELQTSVACINFSGFNTTTACNSGTTVKERK